MSTTHRTHTLRALLLALGAVTGCAPVDGDLAGDPDGLDDDTMVQAVQNGSARTLHTWYSPSRGDYFTTADAAWAGSPGATRSPDYVYVRAEGQVLAPNLPEPRTVPLYQWWNAARGDNLLTAHPYWAGRPGDVRDGYTFVRVEGYAYAGPVAGTLALTGYWNGTTQDNLLTADPRTTAFAAGPAGYSAGTIHGYVLPPPSSVVGATAAAFGYNTMRVGTRTPVGTRPLLLLMVDFDDERFASTDTCSTRQAQFFGSGSRTVAGYFRENSDGRFTYRAAGCLSSRRARDIPTTGVNESTFAGALAQPGGNPSGGTEGGAVMSQVLSDAAARGYDFASYDTDGDGLVTPAELTVVMIYPVPGESVSAHARPMVTEPIVVGARTVRVAGLQAFFGEATGFSTIVHELTHTLGALDLYGTGMHSSGLTLMGATGHGRTNNDAWHLDPWHKIQLGWAAPRAYPITDQGHVLALNAPQVVGTDAEGRKPVIVYDPRRGLSEYFILEYRNSAPAGGGGYDAQMSDWRGSTRGVAVWHVMVDGSLVPLLVPGITIGPGPDGVLSSVTRGDDAFNLDGNGVRVGIAPGPDRILQSLVAAGDVQGQDRMVLSRGAPNGARGNPGLLRPEDGDFALTWADGTPALRLRMAPTAANAAGTFVELSRSRPITARLDNAPMSAAPGATFTARGLLGAVTEGRRFGLRAPGGITLLNASAWSPTSATVSLPATVAPGRYDLVVFQSGLLGASNAMLLDVVR
jgi:M6 family metalloprotease-like protein